MAHATMAELRAEKARADKAEAELRKLREQIKGRQYKASWTGNHCIGCGEHITMPCRPDCFAAAAVKALEEGKK